MKKNDINNLHASYSEILRQIYCYIENKWYKGFALNGQKFADIVLQYIHIFFPVTFDVDLCGFWLNLNN